MDEYGIGIELGYQIIIWERFSIDFLFFGPRISQYKFSYAFKQAPSQELLDNLSQYINDMLDKLGSDKEVEIQSEGSRNATSTFSFANTRFGISLGFVF